MFAHRLPWLREFCGNVKIMLVNKNIIPYLVHPFTIKGLVNVPANCPHVVYFQLPWQGIGYLSKLIT